MFVFRRVFLRQKGYLCTILTLSIVSLIVLCVFQTNLKTNQELLLKVKQSDPVIRDSRNDHVVVSPAVHIITGDDQRKLKSLDIIGEKKQDKWRSNDTEIHGDKETLVVLPNKFKKDFKDNSQLSDAQIATGEESDADDGNDVENIEENPSDDDNNKKDDIDSTEKNNNNNTFIEKKDVNNQNEIKDNVRNSRQNQRETQKEATIKKLSSLLEKLEKQGIKRNPGLTRMLHRKRKGDTSPRFDPSKYPQHIDFKKFVDEYYEEGILPEYQINEWKYRPLINPSKKCHNVSDIYLLFIVKTSPQNFEKRITLRNTWADEKRFKKIRTVFSVGIPRNSSTIRKLKTESLKFKDILLMDYLDTYDNLTLKTISGINWAVAHCNTAKYVISVDDDMYVATDLALKYLKGLNGSEAERLYGGFVHKDTRPIRDAEEDEYYSKWVVSKTEYPYSTYPDYVFGGFIMMSMRTVMEFCYAIPYTKIFKFEDAYIGIVASRLGIVPIHTELVDTYITYSNSEMFKRIIASHNYKTSKMIRKAWECHLSIVEHNIEKSAYCLFLKKELENLRYQIDYMLEWIDLYNSAL